MKRFLLFFVLFFLLFAGSARAEFLTEAQAGFRNIALCYENPAADANYFQPMLVKFVEGQPTSQAGFDSFLFLRYTIHGKKTEIASCDREDFQWFLTSCFETSADVPALNQAVSDLRKKGFLKKDAPIQVMFAIPWLNPKVTDFGDVDGDGISENLSESAGRKRVLNWFLSEIAERMKAFPELKLWGYYMMREGLNEKDLPIAREYCDAIHRNGFRALWIPYFNAPGAEHAYEVGMDAVIMQSNWTFNVRGESGARRNRLVNTAEMARELGFGIELEINSPSAPLWRQVFLQTLETGTQTGFQHAPSAAYFGSRFFWPGSSKPEDQQLYACWMDYLSGKPIQLPKAGTWEKSVLSDGSTQIIYSCREPAPVQFVDLFLTESESEFFSGLVLVDSRSDVSAPWVPAAWQLRKSWNSSNRSHQNVTLELPGEEVTQLRIRFQSQRFSANSRPVPPNVTDVETDSTAPARIFSQSFRKPYQAGPVTDSGEQAVPPATYPDETGRKLIDGVSGREWSKNVGWQGSQPVSVHFDLGSRVTFDEIRVYAHPGPDGGIHLPQSTAVLFSESRQSLSFSGFGKAPKKLMARGDFAFCPDGEFLQLKLESPAAARSVSFLFAHSNWLFLSEVEFLRNGQKVDPSNFRYFFSEQGFRLKTETDPYPDDGKKLTDGLVSTHFSEACTGVSSGKKLRVVVDLESVQPLASVTAWTLDGGSAGIILPAHAAIRFSEDGQIWSEPQPIDLPPQQNSDSLRAVPLTFEANGRTARFVEVELTAKCWAFLSEIIAEKEKK